MTARLTTALWVGAFTARLRAAGESYYIIHKGDAERGGVLLKRRVNRDEVTLHEPGVGPDGRRGWLDDNSLPVLSEGEADAKIAKRRRIDGDLWVVEVDDPHRRLRLDEPPP